jgi:plastocyanin
VLRRSLLPVVFVLMLAVGLGACGGGGGDSASYKEPTGEPVARLSFSGKNFKFTPDQATAPAGIIEIELESTSGGHDLVIEGVPGFKLTTPGSGDTDSAKVELKKGKYTFYCSLPGHRAAGMVGTLRIT